MIKVLKLVITHIFLFILLSSITIATGFANDITSAVYQVEGVNGGRKYHPTSPPSQGGDKGEVIKSGGAPHDIERLYIRINDSNNSSLFKSTLSKQTHQPYLADITRFIAIPIWTNRFITKALDMPILTVPQPAGIVLIGSAAFGLLIRFLRRRYHRLRPLVDYGISFTGLLIVSPIFFVVGIIIKITSPGSMFYSQERVGKNDRLFNMIKFRTMHIGAESQTGPVWARKNDARITGFGRFLRSTHLDELPQLINVLKGEMSIIGPRPERPFFVNKFKDEIHGYTRRLSIKPGITGLAQCYYKYDETIQDVRKKLSYDVLYIKRMCWMLDLRIILKTLSVSLFGVRTH